MMTVTDHQLLKPLLTVSDPILRFINSMMAVSMVATVSHETVRNSPYFDCYYPQHMAVSIHHHYIDPLVMTCDDMIVIQYTIQSVSLSATNHPVVAFFDSHSTESCWRKGVRMMLLMYTSVVI